MSDTSPQDSYLVTVPSKLDTDGSMEYIEKQFSKCLKRQQDNIVLDMSEIESIERNHTNLLTKWIRNLKSLKGSLIIIGVQDDMMPLFKTARLTSICQVFSSMKDLVSKHPNLHIITSDNTTEKVPVVENKALEKLLNDEPVIKTADATTETEEQIEKGGITDVADAIDNILDEEGLNDDDSKSMAKGSITSNIDIKKLEIMTSEDDVSEKLDFLNASPFDGDYSDNYQNESVEVLKEAFGRGSDDPIADANKSESVDGDAPDSPDESPGKAPGSPDESSEQVADEDSVTETSEVRSTEAYYNIMGDSAEGDGAIENDLLDGLDDVSVDDDLFAEEDEETETQQVADKNEVTEIAVEKSNAEQPKPETEIDEAKQDSDSHRDEVTETSEVRSTEAYYNIMGDSADGGGAIENDLLAELDDVSVDDNLFSEEDKKSAEDSASGEIQDSSNKSGEDEEQIDKEKSAQVEISESVSEPEEELKNISADKVEEIVPPDKMEHINKEGDYIEVPIGEINEIIQLSGEYQCLGCGELEYFLKGFRFHMCRTQGCKGPMDGYQPVCVLF